MVKHSQLETAVHGIIVQRKSLSNLEGQKTTTWACIPVRHEQESESAVHTGSLKLDSRIKDKVLLSDETCICLGLFL